MLLVQVSPWGDPWGGGAVCFWPLTPDSRWWSPGWSLPPPQPPFPSFPYLQAASYLGAAASRLMSPILHSLLNHEMSPEHSYPHDSRSDAKQDKRETSPRMEIYRWHQILTSENTKSELFSSTDYFSNLQMDKEATWCKIMSAGR